MSVLKHKLIIREREVTFEIHSEKGYGYEFKNIRVDGTPYEYHELLRSFQEALEKEARVLV